MAALTPVDPQTATGETKELFDAVERTFKRVPNMLRLMANSPGILEAYLRFNEAFGRTQLTPKLRALITVAVAEANGCDYTLSTAMALGRREEVPEDDLSAARRGEATDRKTAAVLRFALAMVGHRGHLPPSAIDDLHAAGCSDGEVVEVIAAVALNIYRNYFNLVAGTEIDFPVVVHTEHRAPMPVTP